ncbi:flagellar export protein FliJ [Campylobacter sp. MIT 21-1685]|uniref:flagellar export protein FliJ n=1 Tax=unclassified Campylobacter TaxID=2593542 RepID=UPI00224B0FF7|nr:MULTISPECIES: flagellar export protein FliJ [unclassified Campylobacter]MCX2683561.1 flagellar export protein FliJ [Campylobacter sp. MIT 21-1684]MCX2751844.1 flagellar export protein FliJ [Campylobacter sp. MIT 21-1682]MCX2808045.1 flagellar export protein FliJ [Campylobacter sp. MIT 21-1685]
MKSKYDSVVQVRKRQLDSAEKKLHQALARKSENEMLYKLSQEEYRDLNTLPHTGSITELKSSLAMMNVGREALARAKEKVDLSKQEIKHYEFLYQKAHLEYEKMKVLELAELKEQQKALEKLEQKFLDEVALSRFFKEKKYE